MGVTITGMDAELRRLGTMEARAQRLTSFLRDEAAGLLQVIERAWSTETSPAGDRWPPRQEASRASGRLRRAHVVRALRDRLRTTVALPYAAAQFFGSRGNPGRNPLPFEPRGGRFVVPESGRAGEWLHGHEGRLREFLEAGGDDGR